MYGQKPAPRLNMKWCGHEDSMCDRFSSSLNHCLFCSSPSSEVDRAKPRVNPAKATPSSGLLDSVRDDREAGAHPLS